MLCVGIAAGMIVLWSGRAAGAAGPLECVRVDGRTLSVSVPAGKATVRLVGLGGRTRGGIGAQA